MGFIVELPGAFVRGAGEEEALSKIPVEAASYARWSGKQIDADQALVVQRHHCRLRVEDGDCEILLNADRGMIGRGEFGQLANLATYSGETFQRLYQSSELRDWVDPSRVRTTFYGKAPSTIQEIFTHVNRTQYYYLSRTRVQLQEDPMGDFLKTRRFCVKQIQELFEENGNSAVFNADNEEWTLKKILRRFIWHDRIHGKAIVRTLQKQASFGLTKTYKDPFFFPT